MINLEWFRTFKVIYEAGSLSAAAQALYISQPGVSLHLSSLEAYTGYRLFDRDTRKMIPTDRGNMLYNYIIEHMNKLEEAENIFHKKSKADKPTLTIGMSTDVFQYMIDAHIAELPFNLITRFGDYPQLLQELNTGTLDLILTPHKGTQRNLEYSTFTKDRIVLVCGSGTNTAELEGLIMRNDLKAAEKWLSGQRWYATGTDLEHLNQFWSACFNTMPGFRPNYVVPHLGSVLRCLSGETGFAVLPNMLCRKELAENSIRLAWEHSPEIENVLYFVKRRSGVYAEEIRKLEQFLVSNLPSAVDPVYFVTAV